MFDLDGMAAAAADQMVVVAPGGLVHEVPFANMRHQRQAVLNQELERAVHRGQRETRKFAARPSVNSQRRKMTSGMPQDVQDGHPLRSYAKAVRPEPGAIFRYAGHE